MIRQSAIVTLALFAAASVPGAAPAQQPAAAAASTKKAAADPNERICRDIATSSRLETKRYCATRAEWQAFEERERESLQLMQRPMQGCTTMGGRKC